MKKVWILEGFISKEKMEKSLKDLYDLEKKATTKDQIDSCLEMIDLYEKKLHENPDGYWLAYQGKTNYKYFCDEAHSTMRNLRKDKMKWRVIEGSIRDDAKTWCGYEVVKENAGVMKYLWATL